MSDLSPADFIIDGKPHAIVSGSALEHVPTLPGTHVVVGPITVTRLVPAGTREELLAGITDTQRIVEESVATERRLIQWSKAGGIQPQNPA